MKKDKVQGLRDIFGWYTQDPGEVWTERKIVNRMLEIGCPEILMRKFFHHKIINSGEIDHVEVIIIR
jgi:hypothetical protein